MANIDFKGIITSVKEASPSHLAFASFIILPVIYKFWFESITSIFGNICTTHKIVTSIIILLVYIICILWIVSENRKQNELRLIRDKVLTRLIANDWKSMSFKGAKKVLGEDMPDEKIIATVNAFPTILRIVRLKDKDENKVHKKDKNNNLIYKPGIGRIDI